MRMLEDRRGIILKALYWSLALVFLWFGILKVAGTSPVQELIGATFPFIVENGIIYFSLGVLEIAIGAGFLVLRSRRIAAIVAVLHLSIATAAVLLSPLAFAQSFPNLTIAGEFVVKNIVLIAASLVVASEGHPRIMNAVNA